MTVFIAGSLLVQTTGRYHFGAFPVYSMPGEKMRERERAGNPPTFGKSLQKGAQTKRKAFPIREGLTFSW
ncbi:hypothetical protein INF35_01140 [Subdoligranulum sp. DSM 109015]|uniref:Uncharacterized protein n=1 Tax=Gemmiger gallinarum TaxID=2779354 RepID=A0ABR9QZV1_9FIRM|nr:hypothetical protein [Gemmiger gallinarum]